MDKSERFYNVPLGDAYLTTRVKATERAVKLLKNFIKRHAKVELENVKLSNKLNSFIWSRGRKKPPRHVKIKLIKEGNVAFAYLYDEKIEEKKKEQKTEEKKEETKPITKSEEEKKEIEKKEIKENKEPEVKVKKRVKKKEEKSGE